MIIYTHPDCLLKFNGDNHPERKERLENIINAIKSSNLKAIFKKAPIADLETISLAALLVPTNSIFELFLIIFSIKIFA